MVKVTDKKTRDSRGRASALRAPLGLLRLCLLVAASFGVAALLAGSAREAGGAATAPAGQPAFMRAAPAPLAQQGGFSSFPHQTQGHSSRDCASCHERRTNDPQPRIPGHKACTDCHLQQFVTQEAHPMCFICHTSLGSRNPPVKAFPSLKSFNVKFDHAQHMTGSAQPEGGCASCHEPTGRGQALSIPTGLAAHQNCYQCHTPRSQSGGRDIGSCRACHDLGSFTPASTSSRAYRVRFSHADHGPRQRLSCAECHSVRAGAPRSQQVTSPVPTQHFGSARAQSCMTCHNNRRAFGGDDYTDCKRCHTGPTFRMG